MGPIGVAPEHMPANSVTMPPHDPPKIWCNLRGSGLRVAHDLSHRLYITAYNRIPSRWLVCAWRGGCTSSLTPTQTSRKKGRKNG